jgi:hypothetical protein
LDKRFNEIVTIACQCGNVFQVDKKKYLDCFLQCPACETIIHPDDPREDNRNE